MTNLKCDMTKDCQKPVSFIDVKGFVYCECHGLQRQSYTRARKLTPKELETIQQGKQISYEKRRNKYRIEYTPNGKVCITDAWLTDYVIFYDHKPAWAHDGVFYRLPKYITEKLDLMAKRHFESQRKGKA